MIVMPSDTPVANVMECQAFGAKVIKIDGLISLSRSSRMNRTRAIAAKAIATTTHIIQTGKKEPAILTVGAR